MLCCPLTKHPFFARAFATPAPPHTHTHTTRMPHDHPHTDTTALAAGRAAWGGTDLATPAHPPSSTDPPADAAAAYVAGERAALLRAFREALPGQQALGALAAAVKRLEARARDGDSASAAAAAAAAAALEAARAASARVDALERERVTPLEAAVRDAPGDRLSAELGDVLTALTNSLDRAAAATAGTGGSRGLAGALGRVLDATDAAARARSPPVCSSTVKPAALAAVHGMVSPAM